MKNLSKKLSGLHLTLELSSESLDSKDTYNGIHTTSIQITSKIQEAINITFICIST